MKIAFHLCGDANWPAGRVVLELMMSALRSAPARPEIALTAWEDAVEPLPDELTAQADEVIRLPGGAAHEARLTSVLKDHGVDVFFSIPTASAPAIELPRVVWPYDFQHVHMPDNFTQEEVERRNRLFMANIQSAARVLLYSDAVRRDFEQFAPDHAAKGQLIRLVPHIPPETWAVTPAEALSHLTLPGKFFYMPNQIQPHKNHALVVDALVMLRRRNIPAGIVCTGGVPAGQEPLFAKLQDHIRAAGVENCFTFLGPVPHRTVLQLMRQSLALLNPSLFEGFGLGVAESAYFAKPAVLSDIPAFHEHTTIESVFFNPVNSDDLAGRMERTWRKYFQPQGRKTALVWRERYESDRAAFAGQLMSLFESAAAQP